MEEITGYIERITFQNGDNGFTVAMLKEPKKRDLTCIVGPLPNLQPGETVRCKGTWQSHLVYGRQFQVADCTPEAPADLEGIRKYLGSGLIHGIGPIYAKRIVELFGMDTLNIIDQTPERLLEIPRFGKKRMESIRSCWIEQRSIRDVMIFLRSHGVSPAYAQKIYKTYGDQSIALIKENPYRLARDIFGIGFKSADKFASSMGIAKESDERIDAGIEFALTELSTEGHTCFPVDEFLTVAKEMLEVDRSLIEARLKPLENQDRIRLGYLPLGEAHQRKFVWLKSLFIAEMGIAKEFQRLKHGTEPLRAIDVEKALQWVQEKLNIELATQQKEAVKASLQEKLHIVTGGPGTGKSTITNAILTITAKLTGKILLAAPTGRAAKRMTEITGRKAQTIHSLLEVDFHKKGFKRDRNNPLECDLLIVDEASMIDTPLMYHLLRAIPTTARVIFVGDVNQLPSVGPGNVLQDMIRSKKVGVTTLTEIFRQAAGSKIVVNAHKINAGSFPELDNHPSSDFFFLEHLEPEGVLQTIVELVSSRLPKKYGLDPLNDIQVLAPMKRGAIGIENLNTVLQQRLNEMQNPLMRSGQSFLVGDKVMQIRNNYQKEVYNGDVGIIRGIDFEEQKVTIKFDDRLIDYLFNEMDEIQLAYAVSIHKYQGSECPCVVIPVHTAHFMLLHRNLLYTGVTRGKKLVVLVGSKKALAIAIANDEVKKRSTALYEALNGWVV